MTIDVKALRQAPADEMPAKKLDFFNRKDRLNKLPVHVGAVIVALAIYVRSFFEDRTPAGAEKDGSVSDDSGNGQPDEARLRGSNDARHHDGLPDDTNKGRGSAVGEGKDHATDWTPRVLLADLTEPLHFTRQAFDLVGISPFPAAFGLKISNDNRPIPRPWTGSVPPAQKPVPGEPQRPEQVKPDPTPSDKDDEEDDDDEEAPNVEPVNRAPIHNGSVRLNDVFAGQAVLIGIAHLLTGATDPDGDPLSIGNLSSDVLQLTPIADKWQIQTEPGMLGRVTITFTISDGEAEVWQSAHFEIVRKTQTLTSGDDLYVGSAFDDDIDALAGDDIIDAMGGNDLVVGGQGDDHIMGGTGNDVLYGGAGDDVIFGGTGNDIIYGEDGNDRLFGQEGNDTLFGGAGDDFMDGGSGDDVLDGGQGDDTLIAGTGNDVVSGGAGNDTLHGDEGDDLLDGGSGSDILLGGSGNDIIIGGAGADTVDAGDGNDLVIGGLGDDIYEGGSGFDTLDFSASSEDLLIHAGNGEASGEAIGDDTFSGFEEIKGGSGDDIFVVTSLAVVISGGRGRDTFVFEVTDDRPMLSEDVVHDILDFMVGDRVRLRDYDITREARAAERDLFRNVYSDDDDDWLRSEFPLLVTHDRADGIDRTIVQADIDNDAVFDFTLNIYGMHLAYAADNPSA